MKQETVDKMIEEAKEEIANEDYEACRAGLKTLIGKVETWTRDLERYKAKIVSDPKGAAREFRSEGHSFRG